MECLSTGCCVSGMLVALQIQDCHYAGSGHSDCVQTACYPIASSWHANTDLVLSYYMLQGRFREGGGQEAAHPHIFGDLGAAARADNVVNFPVERRYRT